ncbi:MAG: hypothetical protein RR338_02215 [Clostridia bacterium]
MDSVVQGTTRATPLPKPTPVVADARSRKHACSSRYYAHFVRYESYLSPSHKT